MNDDLAGLRSRMRALRMARTPLEQERDARAAAARILALPAYRDARTVMAYVAVRGELSLAAVLEDVLSSGRTLALPLCVGPGVMQARAVSALSQLRPGRYGIPGPGANCPRIDPADIDLMLVPGVAFDARGGRVGQGGGYYDRFLPGMRALLVGVCPDCALLCDVPVRGHDVRMNAVITPSATLTVPND